MTVPAAASTAGLACMFGEVQQCMTLTLLLLGQATTETPAVGSAALTPSVPDLNPTCDAASASHLNFNASKHGSNTNNSTTAKVYDPVLDGADFATPRWSNGSKLAARGGGPRFDSSRLPAPGSRLSALGSRLSAFGDLATVTDETAQPSTFCSSHMPPKSSPASQPAEEMAAENKRSSNTCATFDSTVDATDDHTTHCTTFAGAAAVETNNTEVPSLIHPPAQRALGRPAMVTVIAAFTAPVLGLLLWSLQTRPARTRRDAARKIQAAERRRRVRLRFSIVKGAALCIQEEWRNWRQYREELGLEIYCSAAYIQAAARGYIIRRRLARGLAKAYECFLKEWPATKKIQAVARGLRVRVLLRAWAPLRAKRSWRSAVRSCTQ